MKYRRILCLCLSLFMLVSMQPLGSIALAAESGGLSTVSDVVVSQAGYSQNDIKIAYVIADGKLADETFGVYKGEASVKSGIMTDEGIVWGKYLYSIDFSDVSVVGADYTIRSNGESSFVFPIQTNIWTAYQQDLMAYYRMQRNADTQDLMAQGTYGTKYGSNPLVTKGYHPKAFLDDAWDETKTKHYDLVGGWYDAGDYAVYSENQWVTGQMALTYLDNLESGAVDFDFDGNGIPDILDEISFSAEFSLKMVDAFDGLGYNVQKFSSTNADDKGAWKHPELYTDQIIDRPLGAKDDRYTADTSKSVEGTAKMAASLAATARALKAAINAGKLAPDAIGLYNQANLNANNKLINSENDFVTNSGDPLGSIDFIEACITRAEAAYKKADSYEETIGAYPRSNYLATKGLKDPMLWAEAELYLLDPVKNASYLKKARDRIMSLTFNDLQCTNYWNLSTLAMQELYPAIADSALTEEEKAVLSAKIQELLESRVNYFISSANDTPYGVLNELGTFGVNEPHISYVADTLRYYRLFKGINPTLAAQALKTVKKGLYWVFGNNPWDVSWVSGIGTNYTKFIHSRLDADAQSTAPQQGIILPGAMVCGPNSKDTMNNNSEYPWYLDRTVQSDGANQWRYNEHSISIQIGLFYNVMTLSGMNDNPTAGELLDTEILYPLTGSRIDKPVDGIITVIAEPKAPNVTAVHYAVGNENSDFVAMKAELNGTYSADIDVSALNPLDSRKVVVRTTLNDGTKYYNSTVFKMAPAKTPANGALRQALNTTLNWGTYPGATSYKLIVSKDSSLTNPILSMNVAAASYQLSGLNPSTTYYWKVVPNNDIADTSSVFSFTTEYIPESFGLLYPANSVTDQEIAPKFTWSPSLYATDYTLVVADNPNFTDSVYNQSAGNVTSKQIAGLAYETTYYWKVIANGPGGSITSNGGYRTFTTKTNPGTKPGSFSLKGPDSNATGLPTNVTLSWSIANDAASYSLVVSQNADFTSPLIDQVSVTDTSYEVTGLTFGQTYYWKVTAINLDGSTEATNNGISFSIRNFYLKEAEDMALGKVGDFGSGFGLTKLSGANASPNDIVANNAIRLNGNFTTGSASFNFAGADGLYDIKIWYYDENDGENTSKLFAGGAQIDEWTANVNLGSSDPNAQTRTSRTKTGVPLINGDEVRLESTAVIKNGAFNEWSRTDKIEIISSLRSHVFEPIDDKAVYSGQTLNFDVNAASGTGNVLTYSSSNLPTGAAVDPGTGVFTWTPTDLQIGEHTVTITVKDGVISNSINVNIHVAVNPSPKAFNLINPTDGATEQSLTPEFTWEPSEGAELYTLVISKSADFSTDVITEEINGTSYIPNELLYGTTYYWKVTAIDGGVNTEASNNGSSFTTIPDPALAHLGPFTLTAPADGTSGILRRPMLSWTASNFASSYNVVVSENSDLTNPLINKTSVLGTSYTLEQDLKYDTAYYWNIVAVKEGETLDAANKGISFTTVPTPVRFLGRFANNANERKLPADWPGTVLDTPQGWSKKYYGSGEMTWSVNFPEVGEYAFVVRASNDGGSAPSFKVRVDGTAVTGDFYPSPTIWEDFTGVLNITTPGAHTIGIYNSSVNVNTNIDVAHIDIYGVAPGKFALKSPADKGVVNTTEVTLDWTQAAGGIPFDPYGADNYTLTLADNPGFINPLVNVTLTDTSYDVSNLVFGTTYYWNVTAHNVNGDTQCNSVFSFAVMEAPTNLIVDTIEAEDPSITLSNYTVENNTAASGGKVIRASGAGLTAVASYTFTGFDGARDIKVYYFDENDGSVSYKIYVNETEVGSWIANADLGSANPEAITLTSKVFENILIHRKDVIKIEAQIPASSSEWGRIDKIEFTFEIQEEPSFPGEFEITFPADGAMDQPINFNLTWEASKGADSYRVAISKYKYFHKSNFEITATSNSCQVSELSHNTTYYIRVTAVNELGETEATNNDMTFRTGKKMK